MTSSWHKSIVWVIMGWRRVFSEWRRSSCRNMGLHYNSARLLIFKNTYFRPSVRPSVCPSVCHSFLTMFLSSYHLGIFRSYYHLQTWCPCKRSRSKVKVTEVMTSFSRFRTVTPVWIDISRWNDAQSLILLRRGAPLCFKVICHISRPHGSKNRRIWPRLGVSGL